MENITKEQQLYYAKLSALWRFIRVAVPQIPAVMTYLIEQAGVFQKLGLILPEWVVPLFMFLGAIATAFDKFLRDMRK